MDGQVNIVIVPDVQLVKMIIQDKSENPHGTGGVVVPPGFNIRNVPDPGIVNNTGEIIKMEGTGKGVGINDDPQNDDNG